MGFKCGIVGLPNVGKSTLFNALTKAGIEAANYPFCTIDPNKGIVPVPDPRLDKLANIINPQKVIPTNMEFVDIAGLVAGASKGEGLGNQFLAHIRETQAIAHVVRCFENDDITHVAGKISPQDDIEIIETELLLSDLELIEKKLERLQKQCKSGDKIAKAEYATLEKLLKHMADGKQARTFSFTEEELNNSFLEQLITKKPLMYIANVSEDSLTNNPYLEQLKVIAANNEAVVVTVCANIEAEIAELDPSEKADFLNELGVEEPGLDRVIHAGYELLGLSTYFTAGVKEVRAWTIKTSSTAPQAAGKIHSDFEKGFIRAEVISFTDFIKYNGEQGAKDAGKWRLEGKTYIVQDGDVIHFRFNV